MKSEIERESELKMLVTMAQECSVSGFMLTSGVSI